MWLSLIHDQWRAWPIAAACLLDVHLVGVEEDAHNTGVALVARDEQRSGTYRVAWEIAGTCRTTKNSKQRTA